MAVTGRPTKLNKKTIDLLVTALQVGSTYDIACQYANISYQSFNTWMKRGREEFNRLEQAEADYDALSLDERKNASKPKPTKEEKPYLDFFLAITESISVSTIGWLQTIDTVAGNDPVWAARQLAWRYPKEYGGARAFGEVSGGGQSNEIVVRIQYGDVEEKPNVIQERKEDADTDGDISETA